jgi:hypothetical protein
MVKPTVPKRKAMSSLYYSAAWTDSGFLLGCSHEHKTVTEAASCTPCAGGYVVGVENGVMRSLTAEEESEFQCVVSSHCTDNPALEPAAAPAEAAVSDSGYAVMPGLGLVIVGLGQHGPPRGEGETLVEFVLRFLSACGFDQQAEPISDLKHDLINTDMIDLVLSRLSESEARELERMYAEDKHAVLEALENRFRIVLKPKSGCH